MYNQKNKLLTVCVMYIPCAHAIGARDIPCAHAIGTRVLMQRKSIIKFSSIAELLAFQSAQESKDSYCCA